ncbi:anthrone oxygenase family protein [Pedococcus soli]
MSWVEVVVALTALASALLSGALFSFSAFVMRSLGRLDPPEGIRAMQRINEDAPRSLLMVPLMVSPVGSLVSAVAVLAGWGVEGSPVGESRALVLAGAILGVLAFVVTAAANVPRNNALATLDAGDPGAAGEWAAYRVSWTRWNHVRVVLALGSAVLLAAALRG